MAKKKNKDDGSDFYLQRLLKHQDNTLANKSYAIQRFDLLIISISGAGLYLIFELFKFIHMNKSGLTIQNSMWLKIAGIAFTLSIIVNFFSQWSGLKANSFEERWVNRQITIQTGGEVDEKEIKKMDKNSQRFTTITNVFNNVSTLLMIAGLVILASFNITYL